MMRETEGGEGEAAAVIQRVFRGHRGRTQARRMPRGVQPAHPPGEGGSQWARGHVPDEIQRAASLPAPAGTPGRLPGPDAPTPEPSGVFSRTVSTGVLDQQANKTSLWKRASAAVARMRAGGQDARKEAIDSAAGGAVGGGHDDLRPPPAVQPAADVLLPSAGTSSGFFARTSSAPEPARTRPWSNLPSVAGPAADGAFLRTASEGTARPQQTRAASLWSRASSAVSRLVRKSPRAQEPHAERVQHYDDLLTRLPISGGGVLDRSASVPMPPRTRPWSILQSAVLRFKAGRGREDDGAVGFSRTASDGSGAPTMPGKVADTTTRSREEEVEEFLKTQQEVQQLLEARQENASQVLQRSYRSHVARSIYKDERFVQLESPANIIVGAAKGFLARRAMNYNRRVWPLVTILKSNWRVPLARRKLQRMKFAKQHPRMYKLMAKQILDKLLDETFHPTCRMITRDWAADVIGRSFRCNRARLIFWTRFDHIDKLENDIGLDMTAPILIQSMAASLKWSEKNAAAAKLQSCIRVGDACVYRADLQDYDDFITESATMIQCAFRSYRAREKVLMWDTPKCNDAAVVLQLAYRCMREREKFKERRIEWEIQCENAIIIQTQCRVFLALRRFWTRELDVQWPPTHAISSSAALTVQRVFRGHGARIALRTYVLSKFVMMQVELEVKQRTSAHRVQQAWRCHVARRVRAITLHHSYSLVLARLRDKRRAAELPQYDHLVIQDQELAEGQESASDEDEGSAPEDESDGHTSGSSTPFGMADGSVRSRRRVARKLQAVYRGHLARSQVREQWGWDHQVVTQAQMVVWHRKMASKKIQHFWRGYRERKKFLATRLEQKLKKEAIEAEFQADPTLRRVLVLNREVRVRLTAVEETHGTRVRIEKDGCAEIWSQVGDGLPAVWRVYREDNDVLCRVIILTVHTPRRQTLKVSSTVSGIKPSLICTPGWTPPGLEDTKKGSSQPLVAGDGLSLTTLLRMAARAGPNPSGFEPRDYTLEARVSLEEPSLYGDIWAKEKGGVKIKWKSSSGMSSFVNDDGVQKVHSVEIMLLRGGQEYHVIAREMPDVGYYCWNVSRQIRQSRGYKEGVWLRGGTEIISDFEKRLEMQRSLRDAKGNILKRSEIMKFLEPEYQIRVRVKSLHNGKCPLIVDGPEYIESISPHFFIVQAPKQHGETRRAKPNATIRLLFPRGNDLIWTVGTQQTIKWQNDGWVHTVRVSLLSEGVEVATIAESMPNLGVIIYKMPRAMMQGDKFQIRVRSRQDSRVEVDSACFRVVDAALGSSESTFSVNGGVTSALNHTTQPVTRGVRQKMLKTRKAFGEEPRFVGELKPLDLQLGRTDGTLLPEVPPFVSAWMKRGWDDGRGPNRMASSFLDRPEMKTANDKDLFEVFRPRTGPDKLDEWSKEQEEVYNKWRQQKIKRVMAESGIEGEIRDWKDLMDEWEAKNDPEIAKALAKEKEKAAQEMAAAQSLDLWEMMRQRYKSDRLQDPIEEWSRIGAAAQIEEVRAKEAAEAAARAKSKEEELKRRSAREAAKKASKYIMHEGKRIRATPIPDRPYDLQQGKEWHVLGSEYFDQSHHGPPPTAWRPMEQANLELPSTPEIMHMKAASPTARDPMAVSLANVYKNSLPGARDLGISKPRRRISAPSRSADPGTTTAFPSIRSTTANSGESTSRDRVLPGSAIKTFQDARPDSTLSSATSFGATSRGSTAKSDATFSEDDVDNIIQAPSAESGGDEAHKGADDSSERPTTSLSGASSVTSKGALGLKHAEERTSKSGILAVVWAKKTLRRSRAETKEQNAFKRLQTQNFQPIASRRRRLFEYQLQECRVAAQMPQDLYGNAEASKSLGFSQSWLPAARLHHAHFEKRAPGDIQIDDVEMDEERLLDLSNVEGACSPPGRLDFDPLRMLGDAEDELDPIKAQQRAALNEKRRRAIESRRSKSRSRPSSSALSTVSSLNE